MMSVDGYSLLASSIAAIVARVCTHPIDTIKTRLQVAPPSNVISHGAWVKEAILQQSSQTPLHPKSFLSLYRGLSVTLLFSVPALSVYLSCYESTKTWLDHNTTSMPSDAMMNHVISGAVAELAGGTLFTPMEVLKNRLQTEQKKQKGTTASALARIVWNQEGIRGFFRGYGMGLAVFMPHTVIYFVTYEKLKKQAAVMLKKGSELGQLPFSVYLLCSGIASTAGIIVSTPLDVIKTRWQVSAAEEGALFRKGPMAIACHLWLNEGGWRGLFRSLGARIAWGLPTTMISMSVFESLKDLRARHLKDSV
ncbi:mitochondrial carrier domain-containing protein [Phycomyces nitens]|nr:mitochondrial carrier domain-containing protein [Phycomyces nitens]